MLDDKYNVAIFTIKILMSDEKRSCLLGHI